jgi:hypothetical protein
LSFLIGTRQRYEAACAFASCPAFRPFGPVASHDLGRVVLQGHDLVLVAMDQQGWHPRPGQQADALDGVVLAQPATARAACCSSAS